MDKRETAVRLCWPLAMFFALLVAHSVHLYLWHRECGHHCDNSHTREAVGSGANSAERAIRIQK